MYAHAQTLDTFFKNLYMEKCGNVGYVRAGYPNIIVVMYGYTQMRKIKNKERKKKYSEAYDIETKRGL